MSRTKTEADVTEHIESGSTDSPLSQLTKELLGARHALHASQTETSLFFMDCGCLWERGGLWADIPMGRYPSGPLGEFSVHVSVDTIPADSGQIWSPLRALTRGRQRLWPSVTLFEGDRAELSPLHPSGPGDVSASRGQLPAICLHLALHPCNKDPPRQPA